MSTSRGSDVRKRPQKHQNKTAFKNDLHDTSHKTKFLNSLEVSGVCKRCKEIIEWKIKYKKYKPLNGPRKCSSCSQKTVKYAYHMICSKCSKDKQTCSKCCKPVEDQNLTETYEDHYETELKAMLKDLPERKRRTILRQLNKQEGPQKVTPEVKAQIEEMLSKMDNTELDDLNFTDDDSFAESDDEQSI